MASPKKMRGLGKGLDALFGDAEVTLNTKKEKTEDTSVKKEDKKTGSAKQKKRSAEDPGSGTGIEYIDIHSIIPNENQPRKNFDEEKLEELASSIKEHGLIQPVVLRKNEGRYEIVAGERRWRAAMMIGISELPCIVKELSDEENMLLAIIENMQREDLDPIEEAQGVDKMMRSYGLTQEQVSKSLGKSRPYIANCLRLLRLSDTVRGYLSEGKLSAGHARALVTITDEKQQIKLADTVIKKNLSVRQLEKLVQQLKDGIREPRKREERKNADVIRVENDLKEIFGTKVNLNRKGKKGKIEIEFYSREDLDRLIELLKTVN